MLLCLGLLSGGVAQAGSGTALAMMESCFQGRTAIFLVSRAVHVTPLGIAGRGHSLSARTSQLPLLHSYVGFGLGFVIRWDGLAFSLNTVVPEAF